MSYCTLTDIEAVIQEADLIQLTDDGGLGVLDQAKVDAAIASAGDLIDGYLRGKYTLPIASVPETLKTIAVDISLYRLYERRLKLSMPESIQLSYKNAVALLAQIQQGKFSLGVAAAATPGHGPAGEISSNKTDASRVFTPDVLDQF
jgi:phage gp36-like protein